MTHEQRQQAATDDECGDCGDDQADLDGHGFVVEHDLPGIVADLDARDDPLFRGSLRSWRRFADDRSRVKNDPVAYEQVGLQHYPLCLQGT